MRNSTLLVYYLFLRALSVLMSFKTSPEFSFSQFSSSPQNSKDPTELVLHDTASKRSSGPSFKSDPSGLTPLPSRASEELVFMLFFQECFRVV